MRNIFKLSSVLLSFSCLVISPIEAMEVLDSTPNVASSQKESLDRFTITLDKISYEFHVIDFLKLKESKETYDYYVKNPPLFSFITQSEIDQRLHFRTQPEFLKIKESKEDYENYVKATCDKEAVKQMLGGTVANIFGVLSLCYPPIAYEAMVDVIKKEKNKKATVERFTWFIYDESKSDHPYVGYMGLFPPNMVLSNDLLTKMKASSSDVIEISMAFTKNYRGGKGIASKLGAEVLNKLLTSDQFRTKTLLIRTRPDNDPVHFIAKKMGFQMIDTITEELDCGLFKKEITLDLFSLNLSERASPSTQTV